MSKIFIFSTDKPNSSGKVHENLAFFDEIYSNPSKENIAKYERAFNARLAYENNCILKYDYPSWSNKPSKPPLEGDTMEDFAFKFGTTVQEMKDCEMQVERALQNTLQHKLCM